MTRRTEGGRSLQLGYSELQPAMLDESGRRQKGRKVIAVLEHYFGASVGGKRALDLGCSTGFLTDELRRVGCMAIGLDVDRPGLAKAAVSVDDRVPFTCALGAQLPFPDASFDIIVFNHIYEHVPDPVPVMREIQRVLRPEGAVYLGLGNRLGIVEPHYKLPFLSYLPPRLADSYVRAFRRATHYHERFRTRRGLRALCGGMTVWEYTVTVLSDADSFEATDMVPRSLRARSPKFWRALTLLIPTYLWIGTKSDLEPRGPTCRADPRRVDVGPSPR